MARKSAAALSVVAKTRIDGRAHPPEGLTADQRKVWERVTASEPADLFATEATRQLLKDYCRRLTSLDFFSKQVDAQLELAALPEAEREARGLRLLSVRDMNDLLVMRARETKGVIELATKLRLTNQSRYTTKAAGTAGRHQAEANAASASKPWHAA